MQHFDPLHVGETEIQNRGVEIFRAAEIVTGLAIGRVLDDESGALQARNEALREIGIVLDEQDANGFPSLNSDRISLPESAANRQKVSVRQPLRCSAYCQLGDSQPAG
jgi:hypothetical protein